MPRRITIDPDIAEAATLPAWAYRDPEVFRASIERVFAPSWQFVADDEVVRVPGQVYPFTLLEGCLDEPLVLTRDTGDRVHCLSNVCTHRGTLVCEGPGNERFLRCRYHGRRFALDGSFQSMPEFECVKNFPSPRDNLAGVPFARLGKLLFASLRPGVAFDEVIKPVLDRVGWLPFDRFVHDPARSRDYLVKANWALYCDNYLEGFHIPFVHASLNAVLDYSQYKIELFDWCNLQLGVGAGGDEVFDLPRSSPDFGTPVAAYYYWVFPNTMLNFYPWGLSINVVRPLAVDRTRVSFITYVCDESKLDRGAGSGLDRVEREDEAVVEAVQRGVRSRFYESGRYSPTRESGVHHFHRLLAQALGEF